MNEQTEKFLQAMKDIEEGKVVPLDKALTENPPSKELKKIFDDIEKMDAEREAWKKMFDMQSKVVMGLELDKIRLEKEVEATQSALDILRHVSKVSTEELEKENKELRKELELYKDVVRLSDHLEEVRKKHA